MKTYAPKHLKADGKEFYKSIAGSYPLTASECKLLVIACKCLDEIAKAQAVLENSGSTFIDRFGQEKPRNELKIIKDNRLVFARMVKGLNLASSYEEIKVKLEEEKPAPKTWKDRYSTNK
jgi:hypothetical protein